MTLQIQDRVKETTVTTGTGNLTLAGAMVGFRAFSAVCADQDTCWYSLQAVDSSGNPSGAWEVGVGTYNASGNTLSRTTVLASSNAGAAVNLGTGTKQVWIGLPAERVASHARDGEWGTIPRLSDFTWANQGSAVATQREGYVSIVDSTAASGDNLRLLTVAAPATPYSAIARIKGVQSVNYEGFGICFYDSVSGQLTTVGTTGAGFHVSHWNSVTSFSGAWLSGSDAQNPPWFRLRDDGTNVYADISTDGYSWAQIWSNARTGIMTNPPNRVGIYLYANGAQAQCSLHSWKVG